jgi:hypothetical protein
MSNDTDENLAVSCGLDVHYMLDRRYDITEISAHAQSIGCQLYASLGLICFECVINQASAAHCALHPSGNATTLRSRERFSRDASTRALDTIIHEQSLKRRRVRITYILQKAHANAFRANPLLTVNCWAYYLFPVHYHPDFFQLLSTQ